MKKTYEAPELKGVVLSVNDIIQTSEVAPPAVRLKTVVNDKEGLDYGAQSVSLLD